MQFISAIETTFSTHGFDWVYCVLSHILSNPQKYSESNQFLKSYMCLTKYLNNNGLSNSAPQCELIISDIAPLPNGGNAFFSILYRNIPEEDLSIKINDFAATLYPDERIVLIFEPTEQLVNSGDTEICIYKIETKTAKKV